VPTPDEKEFEVYLKRFRPVAPEPLQIKTHSKVTRRSFASLAWFAAALVLVGAALTMHFRIGRTHPTQATEIGVSAERLVSTQPLTVGAASALLSSSSSFKAVVDEMASRHGNLIPKGDRSALAVLSEEKTKL
jgi:hypothetical protein